MDDSSVVGGAVFLATPGEVGSASWVTEPVQSVPVDGQQVRIVGNRAVYVSLVNGWAHEDEVLRVSLEAAQRALDLEAAHGESTVSLRRANEQHIVWWRDGPRTVLRVVITRPLLVSSRVTAGAVRRYEQPITGTGVLPTWGPALRYFRLFQLADDVFDAYRNAFLALEALLDTLNLRGAPPGEKAWLKFGLNYLVQTLGFNLAPYLIGQAGAGPVDQFLDEQYHARRCALFHAKAGRGTLLPGVAKDRQEVSDALGPLIRLVVALIREVHAIIFPSGGMVVGGFVSVMQTLVAHGYEIALANDPAETIRLRAQLDQVDLIALAPADLGALDQVGLEHGFLAEAPAGSLSGRGFTMVASYTTAAVPEDVLGFPWAPSGFLSRTALPEIEPGSATTQHLIRWVLDNLTMPRSRFAL